MGRHSYLRPFGCFLWLPEPGLWVVVNFLWLPVPRLWAVVFILLVSGYGMFFIFFYFVACEVCAQYVGFWLFLVYQVLSASGCCPSSYVLEEVLSVFCFFWWPFGFVYYYFLLGFTLFGNKFLIIQKKKPQPKTFQILFHTTKTFLNTHFPLYTINLPFLT